ncbi:exonuclease 3'-5' domain containing 2 [Angomonas deanei]|nr:exonuclease 3'-5' domain containing 2 [Angomonas deanei]|eukprot:EPY21392.1 exonuclease 3'-5' domain containing 2 [Angomonas deanei]
MTRFIIDPVWRRIDRAAYSAVWQRLLDEAKCFGFVGLDLEWTTKRKLFDDGSETRETGPVATVQLSTGSTTFVVRYIDLCQLIHGDCQDPLLPLSSSWPFHRVGVLANDAELLLQIQGNILKLLLDRTVFKVGVGVMGDKKKIEEDYNEVVVEGCVDLNALYQATGKTSSSRLCSLKDLSLELTGIDVEKNYFVVTSDWGGCLGALSPAQVKYAAADAEASFAICRSLVGGEEASQILRELVDTVPSSRSNGKKARPQRYKQFVEKCRGREKPYYDNIFVYSKDGDLVFTVDKSKAEWYVSKKQLATVREWSEDGEEKRMVSIQLKFNPDFEKFNDAHIRRDLEYFKRPKENMCVVCGSAESLVRFAIVPFMYRKHFPSVYMSHNSYDLVLVCTKCFAVARQHYDVELVKVAERFGIPTTIPSAALLEEYEQSIRAREESPTDDDLSSARLKGMKEYAEVCHHREKLLFVFKYAKAVLACLEGETVIPADRLEEMKGFIRTHAPAYPFYDPAVSCQEEQDNVFEGDATTKHALRFILHGSLRGTSQRSFHEALSLYWFTHHPELYTTMCTTTRAKERELNPSSASTEDLPHVDSHGFFVVKTLLEKYPTNGDKRGPERAIGEFILRWRTYFCEAMNPCHMPEGWKIEDGILL